MNLDTTRLGQIDLLTDAQTALLTAFGLNLIYAIIILIGAFWFSGRVQVRVSNLSRRYKQIDDTLFQFLATVIRYTILIVAVIFVLNRFGIQTTSLIAILGAAGLAIGMAVQGSLSNIAAGVMLVVFRPFRLGDFVRAAGESGTVKMISLFTTELASPDNVKIILPNNSIWGQSIINYSVYPTRRVELFFSVSHEADLRAAEQVLRDIIANDPRARPDPAPFVQVHKITDRSVDFVMHVWVDRSDVFGFQTDTTRRVKEGFQTAGVPTPLPAPIP